MMQSISHWGMFPVENQTRIIHHYGAVVEVCPECDIAGCSHLNPVAPERKYIVMRKNKDWKFFVHYTPEKAITEAKRLAEKHDDKFYVYEIIAKAVKGVG